VLPALDRLVRAVSRDVWIRIVLVLHVLGAITALGVNLTYLPLMALGERAGAKQRAFILRAIEAIDGRLSTPAYGAQLVTGIVLIWLLRIDVLDTSWLVAGIALYLFVLVFAIAVYAPAFRKQVAIAGSLADGAGGGEATPEYRAASARSTRMGLAIVVVVIGIVTLMVSKPTLW
jgi:uncharacterized membrane protein